MKNLNKTMRDLRLSLGLNQDEFGAMWGIDRQRVSARERGVREWSLLEIQAMSGYAENWFARQMQQRAENMAAFSDMLRKGGGDE